MASKEELLAKLSECVVEMEDEEVVEVAKEYIEAGYPADPELFAIFEKGDMRDPVHL